MRRNRSKIICALLILTLIFQMLPMEVKASNTADLVVSIAQNQLGYKEKATNSNLDDFTANAGSANITKYHRDLGIGQGSEWCGIFVKWVLQSAGVSAAETPSNYKWVPDWQSLYKNKGRYHSRGTYVPKPGDLVIISWSSNGSRDHIGIVESVDSVALNYISGNRSNSVTKDWIRQDNAMITGYCEVDYGSIPNNNNPGEPYPIPTRNISRGTSGDDVKWVQKFANDIMGAGIAVDGISGDQTVNVIRQFQSQYGLTVDGIAGTQTINKMLEVWRGKTQDTTPPTISNAKVTSITSSGYTVEVDITDNVGVAKVEFPSWPTYKSSNGCTWYSPTSVSGNHYTFKLSYNDFNKYSGEYCTHIYAWDAAGNKKNVSLNNIGPLTMSPAYTAISGNSKYEVYNAALRWTDAKEFAQSKGGHLLTITSSEEMERFNKVINSGKLTLSGKPAYWIGYTDEKSEGTFRWVTGETGSFTNFRSGEPNNTDGNEHYVGIWRSDLKWNDFTDTYYASVDGDIGFIVEYDGYTCSHSWVKGNKINPSCVSRGTQEYECSICGATKTEDIAATGHKPVTDAAVAATCTKDGKTAGSHCSVCGTVITAQQTVKATGHKWDSGKITKQPTTTSTGIRTYTCTKCGTTKTETVPKLQEEKKAGVTYTTHVQSIGWQSTVRNGDLAGTVGDGKRLEAIKINLENAPYSGGIEYRTHVQTYGWQGWVENGALSGTSGQAKRLEAIQIRLTGEMAKHYDVYYRIQVQSFGWLGWAKNGEYSGSAGYAKRLESIQIVLVEKGKTIDRTTLNKQANITSSTKVSDSTPYVAKAPSVEYQTHVQSIGWQGLKINGEMSGTSGMAKRLEGIKINLSKPPYEGGIRYKTHVQSYGWQGWSYDGSISGTSGQSKRLEAIAIELTGEMAEHYDIYYRVHAQSYG